jgi:chromosome segregation ATPase
MAQKTLTLLFLIGLIAMSQAVFLENKVGSHFAIFSQLKNVEDSSFGKKILDTIALQLGNKVPLSDVASLLKELRSNLVVQESQAKQLHIDQESECKRDIDEYNRRIEVANREIGEATSAIARLESQIEGLNADINNKETQLKILAEREVAAKEAHLRDSQNFATRNAEHKQVLEALDLILPRLEKLVGSVAAPKPAILAELAKIGKSNPIASLVSLASSLDQNALGSVLNKLRELRGSVDASLRDDEKDQADSDREYSELIREIFDVNASLNKSLNRDRENLSEAESNLSRERQRLHDNQVELRQATDGKNAKESQCQTWRDTYAKESKKRNEEVGLVDQVIQIVATKLDTMKDYLKNRTNKL